MAMGRRLPFCKCLTTFVSTWLLKGEILNQNSQMAMAQEYMSPCGDFPSVAWMNPPFDLRNSGAYWRVCQNEKKTKVNNRQ